MNENEISNEELNLNMEESNLKMLRQPTKRTHTKIGKKNKKSITEIILIIIVMKIKNLIMMMKMII